MYPWSAKHPARSGEAGLEMSTMGRPPLLQGSTFGFGLMVPVAGRPALIVLPSSSEIIPDGIVIEGSLPPIRVGGPPTLLATITALAPAAWAFATLTVKLQLPRSASAMAPEGKPTSGSHASVVVPVPSFTSTMSPETPPAGDSGPKG